MGWYDNGSAGDGSLILLSSELGKSQGSTNTTASTESLVTLDSKWKIPVRYRTGDGGTNNGKKYSRSSKTTMQNNWARTSHVSKDPVVTPDRKRYDDSNKTGLKMLQLQLDVIQAKSAADIKECKDQVETAWKEQMGEIEKMSAEQSEVTTTLKKMTLVLHASQNQMLEQQMQLALQ